MPHGFDTLKDVLDVVVVPIVIWLLGARLPRLFEAVRTRKFLALIKRELEEMVPEPKEKNKTNCMKWYKHLDRRFIHENIFEDKNISENRDFILSLDPDISYNTAQLWIHFDKATASWSE